MSAPCSRSRRYVLRGLGGAVLALPVLPSLLSPLEASAAEGTVRKNFVAFLTQHGGLTPQNMFPSEAPTPTVINHAGHDIRRRPLVPTIENGISTLSPVLSAPSSVLTSEMISRMNVLQGLDIPFVIQHHYGMASLGNLASANDAHPEMDPYPRRSIDQVMAYAPDFYESSGSFRKRSVVVIQNHDISYRYADPAAPFDPDANTPVQSVGATGQGGDANSEQLFNALIGTQEPGPRRAPIIDRVRESYLRLKNNPRLSRADRTRLDEHLSRVSELEARIRATEQLTCDVQASPTLTNAGLTESFSSYDGDPSKHVRYFQAINEALALGLNCGTTRIAVMMGDAYMNTFSTVKRDEWHEGVAHRVHLAEQATMVEAKRKFFAEVVLDFASRLSTETLDQSLILWTHEHGHASGPDVHEAFSIPVVTLGGAGGFLNTGNYCDYRNLTKKMDGSSGLQRPGLPWQQLLGTCLQAVGVPRISSTGRNEWAENDHGGYGKRIARTYRDGDANWPTLPGATAWPDSVWSAAGGVLPFLKA